MNKKYFSYLLNTKKTAILFIFLMYLAICSSEFITDVPNVSTFSDALWYGFILTVALTFIFPVILFAFIHQRRSRDVFLALPLKRKEILITNLVFSFVCIYGCMFLTFVILYAMYGRLWFGMIEFAGILIYAIFIVISLLIIHTLLFLLANNTFDGIVMIGAYTVMPALLLLVEDIFYSTIVAGSPSADYMLSVHFSPLYMHYGNYRALVDQSGYYTVSLIYIVITAVFTLIALFLLKKEFIERKSERSEQLSDRTFAYPFVINIYAFTLLLSISFELYNAYNELSYMLIYYLLIFFAYVIAEFVYHRSITFKLSTVLKYLAAVGISLLIAFAGWKSEGFGQARNYAFPTKGKVAYYYNVVCKDDFTESDPETSDQDKICVDITLDFSADRKEQYEDAINIFEKNRIQCIDAYYDHQDHFIDADTGYLTVANYITTFETNNGYLNENLSSYTYQSIPLSLQELEVINQYGTVTIQEYNTSKQYSLSEYMNAKGLK